MPTISGNTVVGSNLTAANGTWNPTPTSYGYVWQICDSNGANCSRSATSTSTSSYTLQTADVGHTVLVQIAPNGNFTYAKNSAPTPIITTAATASSFTNTALPKLSGATTVGSTLTVTSGSWTPTPTSYSYAWHRCVVSTGSCSLSPISANKNSYVIQAADAGYAIVAQVAPNGQWSSSKDSNESAVVTTASINATVVSDSTASGGHAMKFGGGVKISGSVSMTVAASSLTVTAHGDSCGTLWPQMTVNVDGQQYINATVNSTSWKGYSATANFTAAKHTITITNLSSATSTCNLYIDDTTFYSSAPAPTPAPTVALSASPTSVTAGQSSTLTWSSTNASSCTASGAWSGTKATSGSVTVTPTANATYSLSCTGNGGSATASTTVTVSSSSNSGTVLFDGRAKNLTDLQSHEVCQTCGYNVGPITWTQTPFGTHYFYTNETPDIWGPWDATHTYHGCLCFIKDDISLSPDAIFGKVYKASVSVGDTSQFHGNTGGTVNGAGQLSRQRPNDIGKWDYFSIATKLPSWNGPMPSFFDFASLNYETFENDQIALGLRKDATTGKLSYSITANVGYVYLQPGDTYHHADHFYYNTILPVTFGQWDEWVLALKQSTGTDGQLKIYHRVPGGSWSMIFEKANWPTYACGTNNLTGIYGTRDCNGTWGVMDKIGEYYGLGGTVATETSYQSGFTRSSSLEAAESTFP